MKSLNLEESGRKSLWLNWGALQEFARRGKKKITVSVAGIPPQNSNWAPPEYKNGPLPLNQPALYVPKSATNLNFIS